MLKEALEFIRGQFTRAEAARLLSIPGDGRKAFVDQAGTVTPYDVTPPLRTHRVDSVDDMVAAAKTWKAKPVLWISGEAVVLITDDGDRRDKVTLPLVKSSQFARIIALGVDPELEQAELLRTLRVDLSGAINRGDVIATVRKLKWRTGASGTSEITHGGESMGRQIEAEVTGAGDIPESLVVSCPIYRNPGERDYTFTIGMDLEIVPQDQTFRLRPMPDEIERVTEAALAGIRERLETALGDVAIFYGTP